MKEKIYILFILVLNIRVNLTDDLNQVCESLNNRFAHHLLVKINLFRIS